MFLKRISEERVLNVMETKIIFANIEQLLQMHRELLHDLQKAVQLDLEADTHHNTVDLFLKWVCSCLSLDPDDNTDRAHRHPF